MTEQWPTFPRRPVKKDLVTVAVMMCDDAGCPGESLRSEMRGG